MPSAAIVLSTSNNLLWEAVAFRRRRYSQKRRRSRRSATTLPTTPPTVAPACEDDPLEDVPVPVLEDPFEDVLEGPLEEESLLDVMLDATEGDAVVWPDVVRVELLEALLKLVVAELSAVTVLLGLDERTVMMTVTPTAAQDCSTKEFAAGMSEEEQVDATQDPTSLRKDWLSQRQAVSVDAQEEVSPPEKHDRAQAMESINRC